MEAARVAHEGRALRRILFDLMPRGAALIEIPGRAHGAAGSGASPSVAGASAESAAAQEAIWAPMSSKTP